MKRQPRWLSLKTVHAIHRDQIDQFGGSFEIRDTGLLESALMRPQNLWHYEPGVTMFRLAASYGYGLAKNHPFIDGNKRVAFMSMYVFLGLNGFEIAASESSAVGIMVAVADGSASEERLAEWLRKSV